MKTRRNLRKQSHQLLRPTTVSWATKEEMLTIKLWQNVLNGDPVCRQIGHMSFMWLWDLFISSEECGDFSQLWWHCLACMRLASLVLQVWDCSFFPPIRNICFSNVESMPYYYFHDLLATQSLWVTIMSHGEFFLKTSEWQLHRTCG